MNFLLNRTFVAMACLGLFAASNSLAADGTFSQTTAGTYSWDDSGNWDSGVIADGSSSTAFLTSGTSGSFIVTLDTPRTIGNITAETHAWTVQGPSTLTLAGTATPVLTGPAAILTISATLDGTQGFRALGAVTLSGNNIYTGETLVGQTGTATTLRVTNSGALGATGAGNGTTVIYGCDLILNNTTITGEDLTISSAGRTVNGAIQASGTSTWAGTITLNDNNSRIGTENASSQLTVSGVVSGSRPLHISGLGTVILSAANTYTGATVIYRGTLKLDGGNNRLPTGSLLIMGGTANDSTFDLNGTSQQVTGLSNGTNTSTRTITNSSATASTLTLVGTTGQDFAGSGTTAITGNLSLIKGGSFSQSLAESNSYTGNTTITAGTLILEDDTTMTFYIGANGVNNGIVDAGSGSLTLDGDFIFNLDAANLTVGNSWSIVDSGFASPYGTSFSVQGFTESTPGTWTSGNLSFSEATGILSVVPEPTTGVLLAGSVLLMILRRQRSAAASR